MAFTSSCPKCQKQVLVPDGACPDAVVQCPLCSVEYSLSEILASAPPALIVVHPGSAAARPGCRRAAVAAAVPLPEPSEGRIFAAHRVEPAMHDAEPLLFEGDEVQPATLADGHAEPFGSNEPEHMAEVALFESAPEAVAETDQPIETLVSSPSANRWLRRSPRKVTIWPPNRPKAAAPWGGAWGGLKDEAAHAEDGAIGLAEPDQDEGLEHVDFAAITGKAAPGSAPAAGPGEAAVAVEPPKKKRRKRETNPWFASPAWFSSVSWRCRAPMESRSGSITRTTASTSSTMTRSQPPITGKSSSGQAKPPANNQPLAANANPTPANVAPNGPDAGKKTELAMNEPAKENPKPASPSAAKASEEPNPFGESTDTKPDVKPAVKPPAGPAVKPPVKPAVPAPSKTETPAKPDADPFGPAPEVTPVNEKPKPEAKPVVPAAGKKETPAKPDADPFGPPPDVTPVNEKPKPEAKPAVPVPAKPVVPAKTEKPEIGANPARRPPI